MPHPEEREPGAAESTGFCAMVGRGLFPDLVKILSNHWKNDGMGFQTLENS